MSVRYRKLIFSIFLVLVALSITSVQYHRIRHSVLEGPHPEYKIDSFFSLASGIEVFRQHQKYFWKARVFSCFVSGKFASMFGIRHGYKQPLWYCNVIAADCCIWLFLTFALIVLLAKQPLLVIFGTGAALQYAWLPMSEGQINPWDFQSLFWWFAVLLVNETKHKRSIVYIIPIGSMFKEIIAVLSILILFWDDYPIKRRVITFFIVGIGCVAIKGVQGIIGGCPVIGNQSFHYETRCRTGEYWILHRNFNHLFKWNNFNPIYFSIISLWFGISFLPLPAQYRIIALIYCCTVFIPGNITEGRLWHELIPVFFVGYERYKLTRKQEL